MRRLNNTTLLVAVRSNAASKMEAFDRVMQSSIRNRFPSGHPLRAFQDWKGDHASSWWSYWFGVLRSTFGDTIDVSNYTEEFALGYEHGRAFSADYGIPVYAQVAWGMGDRTQDYILP